MAQSPLEFERPLALLEGQIADLRAFAADGNVEIHEELRRLELKAERMRREIFSRLSPWQRVQLARHPGRPDTLEYAGALCEERMELAGDRNFRDDPALVAGPGLAAG